MASTNQAVQSNLTNSFGGFFDKKAEKYEVLPVLGYDFWEMESGDIAKLYVGKVAEKNDKNRGGIIPMTYSINSELVPILRKIDTFPAHVECLVVSVVGAKNKSVNVVTSIKVGSV